MGFRNKSRDNIKIVFVPCYLDSNDGIFDMTYYELLIGQDLAYIPLTTSRGYTPLRALRSGAYHYVRFGRIRDMVNSVVKDTDSDPLNGVHVIHRDDSNYFQATRYRVDGGRVGSYG